MKSHSNPINVGKNNAMFYHSPVTIFIGGMVAVKPLSLPRRRRRHVRTSKNTVFCGKKCTCPWSWLSCCNAQLSYLRVECYNNNNNDNNNHNNNNDNNDNDNHDNNNNIIINIMNNIIIIMIIIIIIVVIIVIIIVIIIIKPLLLKIFNECRSLTGVGKLNPYWRSSMNVEVWRGREN